jgi:signal transduction histidine kinase
METTFIYHNNSSIGIKLKKEFGLLDDTFFNDSVKIIIRSANYLSQTIEDFRNFFKHSDNKEKFQISTAIQESFNILRLKINSNSVKTYLIEDSKVIIEGFKNEFIQVFLNLINNSIDTFKNMEDENRIILINIEKVKNSVEISFQDSAKGINEKIIDKIFEPYFTTKHKSQGTGIGLYMSEQIIYKHFGGRIRVCNADFEVDSKKYRGAKFTIILPLS